MRTTDHLPRDNRRAVNLSIIVLAGLFIFAVVGTGNFTNDKFTVPLKVSAANETSGQWTADATANKPGRIQLTFISRSDSGGYNNTMGQTFAVNDLPGLDASAISASTDTSVNFSLVREPGTITCRGSFMQGKGAGFWTFSPNASFVSTMKSRGYESLTDEDLLRAAFHSLTTKYVDDLKAAGYARLTFEQLSRGAGHEVTVAYIRELQGSGYGNLSMDDLIRAKNHDIDGEYLKEIRALGFEKESLDDVIRAKNHDISRRFMDEMKSAGFDNLSLDELIRLTNHEVTLAFVNDLKAEGFSNLTADNVIRAKTHDINRDVIQKAHAQGYTNISLDELIRLQSRGVIK
jgi:uncharacterized protein (UPF0335 family)